MAEKIHIDRLILDIPGLSVAQAREVAARVGEGLSEIGAGDHPRLSVSLTTHPGEPATRLAARALEQLLRQAG
jgi:hypothetical protein